MDEYDKFKLLLLCIAIVNTVSAQDMWTYFSPDDFARRRAQLMEQIGDGVLLSCKVLSYPKAFVKFRQDNNFYYLTGVEMPGAVLIIDGKAKTSLVIRAG
jgi:Xaa-Pro aminopeptidase